MIETVILAVQTVAVRLQHCACFYYFLKSEALNSNDNGMLVRTARWKSHVRNLRLALQGGERGKSITEDLLWHRSRWIDFNKASRQSSIHLIHFELSANMFIMVYVISMCHIQIALL